MTRALQLLLVLVCGLPLVSAVSGGAAPYGFSVTTPFLDELRLLKAMGKGALGNCFRSTIRVEGTDSCTIGSFPMFCIRMRNNYPTNILEASFKFQHVSVVTIAGKAQMDAMYPKASPAKKAMGPSGGDHGGRYVAMARTQAIPILASTVFSVVNGLSIGNLCQPNLIGGVGYLFAAEGDENEAGRSQWRGTISPYWLHGLTGPLTALAKTMEISGAGGLDFSHFLCYGGYGTVFPGAGINAATAPSMNLLVSAWRAQEIHAPAWPTFGVWGTSLGPLVWQLHSPRAFAFGALAQIPKYSPGGYIQWLFPGTTQTGLPDDWCAPIGTFQGTLHPIGTQMLTEKASRTSIHEHTLSFVYWARWVCCNYCAASNEAAIRQFVPERTFWPSISRVP